MSNETSHTKAGVAAPIKQAHWSDTDGNPAGGAASGVGFHIAWQAGPIGRHAPECVAGECAPGCTRKEPNGAFVEDVLQAVIGRMEYYQQSRFACQENADALHYLRMAHGALEARTARREQQQVEGTHQGT